MIHVLGWSFQGKPEFWYFVNTYSHPEGPGVLQEKHGHGLDQGVDHDYIIKYFWSLRMAVSVSKVAKFGFALKNWLKTCIICIY